MFFIYCYLFVVFVSSGFHSELILSTAPRPQQGTFGNVCGGIFVCPVWGLYTLDSVGRGQGCG